VIAVVKGLLENEFHKFFYAWQGIGNDHVKLEGNYFICDSLKVSDSRYTETIWLFN